MFKVLLTVFLLTVSYAESTGSSTNVSISKNKLVTPVIKRSGKYLGDKINYSFIIKNVPSVPSFSLKFESTSTNNIVSKETSIPTLNEVLIVTENIGRYKKNGFKYQTTIIAFRTGVINFPSFNIFDYHVKAVSVNVASFLEKNNSVNLQEDYPPFNSYLDLIIFLSCIALVTTIISIITHKKKQSNVAITPEKAKDLWLAVYQLFTKPLTEINDLKKYYFNSCEQLKEYVTKVLGISISELTTYEIIQLLKQNPLAQKQSLIEALLLSDPVKFARYLPTPTEFDDYQKLGQDFLNSNQPQTTNLSEGQNV